MKNELLVSALRNGNAMLKMTLADMTDADLIQRPVPNANNALWQLGHFISAEANMVNGCAGKTISELPAGFAERYKKDKAGIDDPAQLGTRDDLIALLDRVRENTANWVATLSAEELAAPAPEKLRSMCATVGHVLMLIPMHAAMHLGQIQVLRRKLGKPVKF